MTKAAVVTRSDAADALDAVLAIWPRAATDGAQVFLNAYGAPPPRGAWHRGHGILVRTGDNVFAAFQVRDSGDPAGTPYLAKLRLANGAWELLSLKGQCPSCLGAGILEIEDRPCDTCGAEGWGVAEAEPIGD